MLIPTTSKLGQVLFCVKFSAKLDCKFLCIVADKQKSEQTNRQINAGYHITSLAEVSGVA